MEQIARLVQIVKKIRDPEKGCPWHRKQTHQSLIPFLMEESCELINAIEKEGSLEMAEELGDVFWQILFHSYIAEEEKKFNLEKVAQILADKLERRHPHVFGELAGQKISADKVMQNWEDIKKQEKKKKQPDYQLDESLLSFPALIAAEKIGRRTAQLNFDWENAPQVSYKVEEEWQELKEEIVHTNENKDRLEEELGDLLFAIAQLARHLSIVPEQALRRANKKFVARFNKMEKLLAKDAQNIEEMNQLELDQYWNKVKQGEKQDLRQT